MRVGKVLASSAIVVLLCSAALVAPLAATPAPAKAAVTTPAPSAITTPAGHVLDATDVNAWLDGYLPYAISTSDIAGAVIVVVKDGQVLTSRGFGYADVATKRAVNPDATQFRPGSVSKLFAWTAVMQLLEAGKVDLDADINRYLDFKIPPRDGKPVTLRNLMTHTPGFEEAGKHLFVTDVADLPELGYALKRWVPERMHPPGEVPAYSNYGAALAGYIVQRVSGEPFSDYVERHIFNPLGMQHSTLVQPLPAAFEATMSKGYSRASEPAKPYELVGPYPAGSSAVTAADMARFMIAHLQDGHYGATQILKPETARLMHTPTNMPTPPFAGMPLGFYREDRNGHIVIGHGGDTELFHSDLHLFLDDGVGFFVSFNSAGNEGARDNVRALLLNGFADRYFPPPPAETLPTLASAKQDSAFVAGNYWGSRRSSSNFFTIFNLAGELSIDVTPDGELITPFMKTPGGGVKRWREVGPFLWQEIGGRQLLKVVLTNGKVNHFSFDDFPAVEVFQPVPAAFRAAWNLPLFYVSLAILVLTTLLWPISAIVRRRLGRPSAIVGRAATLGRLIRFTALINVLSIVGWLTLVSILVKNFALMNDSLNPWLHLLQLLGLLGVVGAIVACVNVGVVFRDKSRGWWGRAAAVLLALACLDFAWLIVLLHVMGPSVDF